MIPYSWMWSPDFHFPFSGSVTQDILPDMSWFFGSIKPDAGIGQIEKEVFDVASYGKQLGLILDVLVPLLDSSKASSKSQEAKAELIDLYDRIERLKKERKNDLEAAAVKLLTKLKATDEEMLRKVVERFQE